LWSVIDDFRRLIVRYVMKQKLFSFGDDFHIRDDAGRDVYFVDGKAFSLGDEYAFTRGDRTVATVSKKWFSWSDTYGVDIERGEDDVLILASTVVIDMACHSGDRR
jgi:uncharacterized protein YxjI